MPCLVILADAGVRRLMFRPFSLTLTGIVVLIGLGIIAAIAIGSGEAQQRFLILIGIIGTAVTALLAVYRAEANAERIERRTNELSVELDRRASMVEETALGDLREVKRKIDENTEISTKAFEAANDYTARLEGVEKDLTEKFNRLLEASGGNDEQDGPGTA